jgi:hypothetical protein
MAKLSIVAGATSQSINLFIQNSTSTTGAGLTAVAPAGGSLLTGTTAYYSFSGANAGSVAISLSVLAATTTAWTSGGIVTIDDTHMAGWVRLDIPNAVIAASKGRSVSGLIYGGTNMAPCPFEIELTGVDNQDAVHFGLSSLPNTAVTTNGSLITSGTGTAQLSTASGLVNVGSINSVSTSSVTTVSANQGTTQPINFSGTGSTAYVKSDVESVATDTTAPGNIALTFNGTGYVAPTAPATQSHVANIAVTSAALNTVASGATYTTGTDTGGYTNTFAADGVYDSVAAVGNAIDMYYQFNLSGTSGATAVGCNWLGYLVGTTNTIKVYAYNWSNAAYDQVGSVIGISGVVNISSDFDLTTAHTGTGGNLGLVRIRFAATGLTLGVLNTDRILLGYAVPPPTAAAIASGVWQDATSGDFTVASSIGLSLYTAGVAPGALGGIFLSGTNTGPITVSGGLSLTGAAASGATPATNGLKVTGGAASTTSGGTAAPAIAATGGAGAASTNGAASGVTFAAGGTNTVASVASGLVVTGTSNGHGLDCESGTGATGDGARFASNATAGNGVTFAHSGSGVFDLNATTTALVLAKTTNITGFNDITAAQAATGVWTDTTSGDFANNGSPGKIIVTQLGGTFTTNSSSVFTSASLANAPTGGSAPTVSQIATAVWQDTTAGDFTVASSIGKSLYTAGVVPGGSGGLFIAGSNAATTVNFTGTITTVTNLTNLPSIPANWLTAAGIAAGALNGKGDWLLASSYTTPPTVAAIATGVWTDTTSGDFAVTGSPGKVIVGQLGGSWTTTTSSVYSSAALANAPTGGSAPTVSQIATAVWEDLLAGGDFGTAGSIGLLLATDINATISSRLASSGYTVPPTVAQIATGVWQDTTSGDFTVTGSPGKVLVGQLGGTFTTTTSSIFTSTALENAPTGGTAPTVAQIVTGVWTDLLSSSDFSTAGSIGALLKADTGVDTSGVTTLLARLPQDLLFDGSGNVKANAEVVSDKTGYSISQAFPANFAALNITSGGAVTVGTNDDKAGYALASNGLDAVTVETGLNARQSLSIIAASTAGVLSGATTNTYTFDGAGVITTRIVATLDGNGNRLSVTLSPPA